MLLPVCWYIPTPAREFGNGLYLLLYDYRINTCVPTAQYIWLSLATTYEKSDISSPINFMFPPSSFHPSLLMFTYDVTNETRGLWGVDLEWEKTGYH